MPRVEPGSQGVDWRDDNLNLGSQNFNTRFIQNLNID